MEHERYHFPRGEARRNGSSLLADRPKTSEYQEGYGPEGKVEAEVPVKALCLLDPEQKAKACADCPLANYERRLQTATDPENRETIRQTIIHTLGLERLLGDCPIPGMPEGYISYARSL